MTPPATTPPGATPPPATTLPGLIRDSARATPDAPALAAGDLRWTYAELDLAARRAAAVLAEVGVRPGDSVGLLATNTEHWPAAALGAMRLGARVDCFNTWVKARDLDHLLGAARCRVLVIAARVRSVDMLGLLRELVPELWSATSTADWRSDRYPDLRAVVVIGDAAPPGAHRWEPMVGQARPVETDEIAATGDEPAYVMYTSGSTKHPKAVPLIHRHLIENGFHIGDRMGLGPTDRVWLGSPLFWSFGGANALMATFTHGACLVLQEQFSAVDAAAVLAAERCTAAYLLPSIIDALADLAEQVRAVGVRTGVTIGRPEEIRRAVDELGIAGICNIYGSTEVYGNCCVTAHDASLEQRLSTQGPPLPGVAVRVVAEDGTVLGAGELGELQVRGRVMPGYLGAPEATAEAMTPDGWYRTGDQAAIGEDGAVRFHARLTEMIKTSGINVAPAEVESYLIEHPSVTDVAVVGAPHPGRDEVVVAYVTGRDVDCEALARYCRDGIAGYKVPWLILAVPELPRTDTGKLARRSLLEQAAEQVRRTLAATERT